MKYILLVGDGMADYPIEKLDGKTPLQAAYTPNLDYLAENGMVGMIKTIPKGMSPGSDVANLSVLGYDPEKYYSGRAPLEAVSMGVKLKEDEIAFRCNLVTIEGKILTDYSAGHISSSEAKKLIKFLDKTLGSDQINFYPGVSYRHLIVIKDCALKTTSCLLPSTFYPLVCTPPHDITGKPYEPYLPTGSGAQIIRELMFASQEFLQNHNVNQNRKKENKNQASMIWLWGQGKPPKISTFGQRFGLTGAVISAVDLIKGIGKCAGLEIINVPGATGYLDTNFVGKSEYALTALKDKDFIFIHVEAPDEAGHNGDLQAKIKAIEDFDSMTVGTIVKALPKFEGKVRILALTDHPTPISSKTHTADEVPFILFGYNITPDKITSYNELSPKNSLLHFEKGHTLMDYFIRG
ncbi:MAG: cofactor-independent phosphoglycerate mutase [bacterium]|nr:cofactor-independent phosphoglycerate mutase [bacterium]